MAAVCSWYKLSAEIPHLIKERWGGLVGRDTSVQQEAHLQILRRYSCHNQKP